MLSKAHLHMRNLLKIVSRMYNVMLLEEVKDGNKRFDFYLTTNPPIVVEIDGDSHFSNNADGFFFKNSKQLSRYKQNDEDRNRMDKLGKIKLIRYSDKEFPSLDELLQDFKEIINILEEGNDEKNYYYSSSKRKQEIARTRKIKNKEFREKLKQKSSTRNRFE